MTCVRIHLAPELLFLAAQDIGKIVHQFDKYSTQQNVSRPTSTPFERRKKWAAGGGSDLTKACSTLKTRCLLSSLVITNEQHECEANKVFFKNITVILRPKNTHQFFMNCTGLCRY